MNPYNQLSESISKLTALLPVVVEELYTKTPTNQLGDEVVDMTTNNYKKKQTIQTATVFFRILSNT